MNQKFEIGQLVATRGVDEKMKEDAGFQLFVQNCFGRYVKGDWGDLCEEDRKQNDKAVKNGERILAAYKRLGTQDSIWIITEWDRSATTILFPEEY